MNRSGGFSVSSVFVSMSLWRIKDLRSRSLIRSYSSSIPNSSSRATWRRSATPHKRRSLVNRCSRQSHPRKSCQRAYPPPHRMRCRNSISLNLHLRQGKPCQSHATECLRRTSISSFQRLAKTQSRGLCGTCGMTPKSLRYLRISSWLNSARLHRKSTSETPRS